MSVLDKHQTWLDLLLGSMALIPGLFKNRMGSIIEYNLTIVVYEYTLHNDKMKRAS